MLEELGTRFLRMLPAERAHRIGIWAMKHRMGASGAYRLPTKLFDKHLVNPLGISAGFDKYAELFPAHDHAIVQDYGFGFIEEGSFTFRGGKGNPQPRLFRLPRKGLLNRMGLNCLPAEQAARRLSNVPSNYFAVSIAKTHDPKIIGDRAIMDIAASYEILKDLGIYTIINLSCPNTKEGKTFEDPAALRELLPALREKGPGRPMLVKLSPGLSPRDLQEIVETAEPFVDGYEAVNTLPTNDPQYGKGGKSGPELYNHTLAAVRDLRKLTNKPIIAVGGISTGNQMIELKRSGANAFLVYTGFVYEGPGFAHRVLREFQEAERAA